MGNSTTTLQQVNDYAAAKGIPVPTQNAAGYGTKLAVKIANDVMGDIIAERFNWKWNRAVGPTFYTNSYQQDYPQLGLTNIGWLEDADRIDINNTSIPKPLRQLTVHRQLSRNNLTWKPVEKICWMYNSLLSLGTWPGAGVTFYPLVTANVQQNPIMSMRDVNGNILIVTNVGTTGLSAPSAPLNAVEGTPVSDGTVTWMVVAATSQGFRVDPLPGAAGPVWQITPYYQMLAPRLTTMASLINPIPDDYSKYFQVGYETYCLQASPNPGDRARFEDAKAAWIKSMMDISKQGDREADAYGMLPVTQPVESVYPWRRNPQDPSQPY